MSGFLKFVGLIACLYGVYYVLLNLNEQTLEYIIYFFGIIGFAAFLLLISRMFFGEKWKYTIFKKAVVGEDLVVAIENTLEEFPNVKKNTWSKLAGNLIFRFTRIGIFALALASLPIILLFQQNRLLYKQNIRLDEQTHLLEADRRGSLVHLFSSIMDAIDRELSDDVEETGMRDLTPQLISRIISLSHALKPYRFLENDELRLEPLSPERGQLFITLIYLNLEDKTIERIFSEGNFRNSDLRNTVFNGHKIPRVFLNFSDLSYARFTDCIIDGIVFYNSKLNYSRYVNTQISNVRFDYSDLTRLYMESGSLFTSQIVGSDLSNSNLFTTNVHRNDIRSNKMNNFELSESMLGQFIKNKRNTFDTISMDVFKIKVKEYDFDSFIDVKGTYGVKVMANPTAKINEKTFKLNKIY